MWFVSISEDMKCFKPAMLLAGTAGFAPAEILSEFFPHSFAVQKMR
jgi:hypothetical protein